MPDYFNKVDNTGGEENCLHVHIYISKTVKFLIILHNNRTLFATQVLYKTSFQSQLFLFARSTVFCVSRTREDTKGHYF